MRQFNCGVVRHAIEIRNPSKSHNLKEEILRQDLVGVRDFIIPLGSSCRPHITRFSVCFCDIFRPEKY